MAVGPLRALLAAHAQATSNRALKEAGARGRLTLVLLLALFVPLVVGPLVLGVGFLGYVGGRGLPRESSVHLVALFVGLVPLALGLSAGVVAGGGRRLAWESYRAYPVRMRPLFAAEMIASLADAITLVYAACGLAFAVGLMLSRPAVVPVFAGLLVMALAWLACAEFLVGALGRALVQRLRWMLAGVAILLWLASVLGGTLSRDLRRDARRMDRATAERLVGALRAVASIWEWFPPTQGARGMADVMSGEVARGLARQLYPLGCTLLAVAATYRVLARETAPERRRGDGLAASRRDVWTFRSAARGVARLHWHMLLRSQLGRFGLLAPLVAIVLLRGPARTLGGSEWALPAAFAYLALAGVQFQLNQFGLDGPGIKTLLLLPIGGRALLLGKLGGLAMYQGLQLAVLVVALQLAFRPRPTVLLAGVALAMSLFVVHTALGHWVSVWQPRRMYVDKMKSGNLPLPAVLIHIVLTAANGLFFGGLWALVSWLAPAWLLPAQVALLAVCAAAYGLALPALSRYLESNHERLVERLS